MAPRELCACNELSSFQLEVDENGVVIEARLYLMANFGRIQKFDDQGLCRKGSIGVIFILSPKYITTQLSSVCATM